MADEAGRRKAGHGGVLLEVKSALVGESQCSFLLYLGGEEALALRPASQLGLENLGMACCRAGRRGQWQIPRQRQCPEVWLAGQASRRRAYRCL